MVRPYIFVDITLLENTVMMEFMKVQQLVLMVLVQN